MKAITINQELKSVTEKHMDMDWLTIFGLIIAAVTALFINIMLPGDDVVKGIISMIAAAPVVLVSVKDFYGLKSYRLASAVVLSLINDRPLIYESQGIWKELNRYAGSREKKFNENEKSNQKHSAGDAFIELNNNIPMFSDEEKMSTEAFERYSDLDDKGRCGVAFANICQELMPTKERGDIGDIKPSGWHTVKYNEVIEDNYLYNRSHLIAYSLAGENSNEKNLITGTRFLNQETMQIFELKVLDYVNNTGNHVLYRVTPVFDGDDALAKGVQMEAWSVEDNGKGICFNVFCFNIQPYIDIDYSTGDSSISKEYYVKENTDSNKNIDINENDINDVEVDTSRDNTEADNNSEETTEALGFEDMVTDFVVNTNSGKIHSPNCRSVNDMAEHNKWEYTGTLNELKQMGYVPCSRCLGDYK